MAAFPVLPAMLIVACMLATCEMLDRLAAPRARRSLCGLPIRAAVVLSLAGILLCLTGRLLTAGAVTTLLVAGIAAGSNAKRRILGEPLCFTDFALVREMAGHPQFYWGAVPARGRWLIVLAVLTAFLLLGLGSAPGWSSRLAGFGLVLLVLPAISAVLRVPPWRNLMRRPDLEADIARYGLLATLLVYPLRLLQEPPLRPVTPTASSSGPVPLVVVVQCESFADPADLPLPGGPGDVRLPGLQATRQRAWQSGRLMVSGFGAYTMRSEYGVLFGRSDAELGFRRYDPFLSAGRTDCDDALPARLRRAFGRCRAIFVHPHPLSFYRRDRLMPKAGFGRMLGEPFFAGAAREGPYVSDAALGDAIEAMLDTRPEEQPDLIYAVSIENHGPWNGERLAHTTDGVDAWLHHARNGDRLLSRLIDRLETATRPAVLCFFGDHRPSIPPALVPGGPRHTPFAVILFPQSRLPDQARPDSCATPAELHNLILEAARAVTVTPVVPDRQFRANHDGDVRET